MLLRQWLQFWTSTEIWNTVWPWREAVHVHGVWDLHQKAAFLNESLNLDLGLAPPITKIYYSWVFWQNPSPQQSKRNQRPAERWKTKLFQCFQDHLTSVLHFSRNLALRNPAWPWLVRFPNCQASGLGNLTRPWQSFVKYTVSSI